MAGVCSGYMFKGDAMLRRRERFPVLERLRGKGLLGQEYPEYPEKYFATVKEIYYEFDRKRFNIDWDEFPEEQMVKDWGVERAEWVKNGWFYAREIELHVPCGGSCFGEIEPAKYRVEDHVGGYYPIHPIEISEDYVNYKFKTETHPYPLEVEFYYLGGMKLNPETTARIEIRRRGT